MPNFMPNMAKKAESDGLNEQKTPFVQVLLEVIEDSQLSAQALRLYLLLTAISRGFPSCWPTQTLLAAKLGVSERSVRQYLKELEKQGLIAIEHRGQPGQNLANLYHLKKLVSGKPLEQETGRKKSSGNTGSFLPPLPEIVCRPERKETSGVIHESKIHESIDLNTLDEKTESVFDGIVDKGVCVAEVLPDKFNDQEAETEQEQNNIYLIEQQLKLAGVSAVRARKAAKQIAAKGRTSRYIEQWQRWIADQKYIKNPAAYLLSRIQENTDVPRENRPTQDRLSSWSKVLSRQVQPETEVVIDSAESEEVAAAEPLLPDRNALPGLKLIVDNTVRPSLRRPQDPWDEDEEGLRLVVDNAFPGAVEADFGLISAEVPQDVSLATATEELLAPESDEVKSSVDAPTQEILVKPESRLSAPTVDLRLKELMVQRDERIKRVKRLEVVGDTLYVAFWFRHEAEHGVGPNWLADAKWFYPQLSKVELVC